VRDIPADPKVQMRSLGRQTAHLVVHRAHPLAGRRCRFAEAWAYGLATTRMPSPVKAQVGRLLGLPLNEPAVPAIECDDLALLRTLALTTETVVATSDAAVREDLEAGTLVRLEVTDLPAVYSEMGVVMLV